MRSITIDIQLAWAIILHAEHFIRAPCFCERDIDRIKIKLKTAFDVDNGVDGVFRFYITIALEANIAIMLFVT